MRQEAGQQLPQCETPSFEKSMIILYWTSQDIDTPPAAPAWQRAYRHCTVFGDDDILPLLPPDFVPIFQSIRLPSAKSDLARLLLLREYGGLYIDAHIGPTSPARLLETLDALSTHNLILFGQGWEIRTETDFHLMNGVLAARKGADELDLLIGKIIQNIIEQRRREASSAGYVPYDLHHLTGTHVLIDVFFDTAPPSPRLKPTFEDKVHVHQMADNQQSGFEIAAYYSYRKPNGHWSERQRNERFFLD